MNCKLKCFYELTVKELYEIIQLRCEVFVVEQECAYNDLDDMDQLSYHLFLEENDSIIAVLRIIPENVAYEEITIGRLAVKKSYRGNGFSRELMLKAIDFITNDLGKSKIRLSGQAYLMDFYISLGFEKVSDSYLEDGIEHFEFLYEI